MSAIRTAIWTAVSTEEQAREDKVSLAAQEESSRALIAGRAWKETAGSYVVAGASRTRWVNLRDAELAIPELRRMLDYAQVGDHEQAGNHDQGGEHDQGDLSGD